MAFECVICCEESLYFSVGECEHQTTCLKCTVKLRSKTDIQKCIVCNKQLNEVIVLQDQSHTFRGSKHLMQLYDFGIYYTDDSCLGALVFLSKFKCSENKCECTEYFKNTENYKKHLSRDHAKFLCDLCIQNEILLMNEYKTFTADELEFHLTEGTFDSENNLVSLHPKCRFCERNFFNDESLKEHLSKEHEKCHLCKEEVFKFVYYKNAKSLQTHLRKSHFVCRHFDCEHNPFQAFKTDYELSMHNKKVHGIGIDENLYHLQPQKNQQQSQIKDSEGMDMKGQFLSERKKRVLEINEDQELKDFNQKINLIYLFKHLTVFNNLKSEQEKQIVSKLNEYERFNRVVFIDSICFNYPSNQTNFTVNQFLSQAKEVLQKQQFEKLSQIVKDFQLKKTYDTEFLFYQFQELFGMQLYIKYLYLFSIGIMLKKKQQIQQGIEEILFNLDFKENSFVKKMKNWKQFYHFLSDVFAQQIIERIQNARISLDKKYVLHQDKVVQMVSAIKGVSIEEASHFVFLQNFLMDQGSLSILQKCLVINEQQIDQNLSQMNSIDLLLIFLYFNLIILRFENKEKIKGFVRLNPNLLKVFLRYYPDLAKDLQMRIQSESEDYNFSNKQLVQIYKEDKEESGTIKNTKQSRANLIANKDAIQMQKNDKFVMFNQEQKQMDDKFEFPDLKIEKGKQLKKQQQEIIDDFPDLEIEEQNNKEKSRFEQATKQKKSQWEEMQQQNQQQQNQRTLFSLKEQQETELHIISKKKKKKLK